MDYTSVGSSSSFSSMSDKNLLHSEAECWLKAEKAAQDVLFVVQPTVLSYKKRLEIVSYVRELIRDVVGDEVRPSFVPKFWFGWFFFSCRFLAF